MLRLVPALLLLALTSAVEAQTVRVTYVFSDGQMPIAFQAYKELLIERPELRDRVELKFLTESLFDDTDPSVVAASDVLVFDIMNQQMLDRFDATHDVDIIAAAQRRGRVIGVGEGLLPHEHYVDLGLVWDERARAFWQHSGLGNQVGLLKFALTEAGIEGLDIPEVIPSLDFGYYYPTADGGRVFATWAEFDAWRAANGKRLTDAPRIALGFYRANFYTGDTEVIDALIAEIERHGAEAIPLFGYPGAVATQRLLVDERGATRADVALSFLFRFADFQAASLLTPIDIPIINLVTLYGRTEADWRASSTGLSIFEGTFQIAVPELAGLIAPTVVGSKERVYDIDTNLTIVRSRPIDSRLGVAVERALGYAALARTPNANKHVAIMFYNYPPGKASIGASYLNVEESLANILGRLRMEGYDLGTANLDAADVLADISAKARNVGGYAPGELDELLAEGAAVQIPVTEYRHWLNALAPALRDKILADWGDPEDTELMAAGMNSERALIVPIVRYGNVVLLPQPARGWGEDQQKLYHAKDLAPHHQYVAAYAWLRNTFGADAVIHLGTHGTLEWLDGKDVGQTEADASEALIGDLPDLYIYNVDVVGEGLVARRRGMAALIDHMVPPFVEGGLYADLAALSESINDYDRNLHENPELARAFGEQISEQVIALGIAKDLGLELGGTGGLDDETVHRIQDHMLSLRSQNIPYGLHAFGRLPAPEHIDSTVSAIVNTDRSLMPIDAAVLDSDMRERIAQSATRELDSLVRALDGKFLPVGSGGEPIRNPDSYPTGKNFYGIDPDKVPKRAAWALGVKLADQMLAAHLQEHGSYPEKVSFVIWGDETMRHEGVLESQIFHLLGTRPVWNARDKVVDVEVVPRAVLGRPRVDIVIASAAEGMFNNVTLLMDKAVQQVKAIDEADNFVRRHYLATRAALIDRGYAEDEADRRAGVRIFDEPPGTYNLNTSKIVEASGTWDSDQGIGDDYLRKMGHGFGNGFWGEPMEDVFRLALEGTSKVVHSSSTMLYGALDNDDFFMYMGGLTSAIRNLGGEEPELLVANTRDPANPEMSSMDEFIGTEFRSRYVNPTWITGMQQEGYSGATEMQAFVEYLWGWDATATSTVDDAMWQETFATYVQDKYDLGMDAYFDEYSPFAFQSIAARMIETIRKDYWQADEQTLTTLLRNYLDSVAQHGAGCAEHTCGNPRLLEYIAEQALAAGIPVPEVEAFERAFEEILGAPIAELAAAAEAFVQANEASLASRVVPGPEALPETSVDSAELQGYLMQSRAQAQEQIEEARAEPTSRTFDGTLLALAAGLVLLLATWRWRHRHT